MNLPMSGPARRQGRTGVYLPLLPMLALLLFALAGPALMLAFYSLWTQQGVNLDTTPSLNQYAAVLTRDGYRTLFLRSIGIAAMVTLASLLLAYPMAYYVAFHTKRGKFLWLLLLTIPFWTSYLLRIFAWKVILGYNGVLNSALLSLHLIAQPLEFLLYNRAAVVLTLTHAFAAFAILPLYVSLEKIDRSLLDAAADLGDGPWRRFLRVTLPLSLPGVIGAGVLIFVPVAGDYLTPTLVGGTDGVMIANLIQVQFGRAGNWPLGAALALTTMALVATLAALAAKGLKRAVGAIK